MALNTAMCARDASSRRFPETGYCSRQGPRGEMCVAKMVSQHCCRSQRRQIAFAQKDNPIIHMQHERIHMSWQICRLGEECQQLRESNAEIKQALLEAKCSKCLLREDIDSKTQLHDHIGTCFAQARNEHERTNAELEHIKQMNNDMKLMIKQHQDEIAVVNGEKGDLLNTITSCAKVQVEVAAQTVDDAGDHSEVDTPCLQSEVFHMRLEDFRAQTLHSLTKLAEASNFFKMNEGTFDTVDDGIEMYWRLFVPDGIRANEEEYDLFEKHFEDMEMNRLGHWFTFDRGRFWASIHGAPLDIRQEVVNFAVDHSPASCSEESSSIDFEIIISKATPLLSLGRSIMNAIEMLMIC